MFKPLSFAALCMILGIKKPSSFASTSNNGTKNSIIIFYFYQSEKNEPLSLQLD